MSGGSMNHMYLCADLCEPERLIEGQQLGYIDECMEMVICSGLKFSGSEAVERDEIIDKHFVTMFEHDISKLEEAISIINKFAQKYAGVMHACEWKKSGDWSIKQVREECKKCITQNQFVVDEP